MYHLRGGNHLHDFSPYDNHGTIKAGVAWKDGRYGWALEFNGVEDESYVNIPYSSELLFGTGDFTVVGWGKTSEAGWQWLASHGRSTFTWRFGKSDTDHVIFRDMVSDTDIEGTTTIDTGRFYQYGARRKSGDISVFLNGEKENTVTATGDFDTKEDLGIGRYEGTVGDWWNGIILLVRFYNVAKSDSWFSRRFARTREVFGM